MPSTGACFLKKPRGLENIGPGKNPPQHSNACRYLVNGWQVHLQREKSRNKKKFERSM